MITLHTFGPFLGAPDASPFVIKAMLLLKLAGLPYVENAATRSRRRAACCPTSRTRTSA